MSSFVVQGFIMLSGLKLFLNKKYEMPYGKYLKSRLLTIVLPYTLCFIVYYAAYMVAFSYPVDVRFILKQYLTGGLVCHLYFIPLLLQFDLLLPLWKKIVDKVSFIIAIPFSVFVTVIFENSFVQILSAIFPNFTFVYNDRLFTTYVAYWIIGCYIGKNYDTFCEMLKKNSKSVIAMFLFSLLLNGVVSYISFNVILSISYVNAVHDLYILCTIIFLFVPALKYSEKIFLKIGFLKLIDKSSFYIYLYHMLVLLAVNKLLEITGIAETGTAFAIRAFTVYLITPILCIIYIKLKKKILKK